MGRQVTIDIHRNRKNDTFIQQELIDDSQYGLIRIKVIFGMEFRWVEVADLLVIRIKSIGNREYAVVNSLFHDLSEHFGTNNGLHFSLAEKAILKFFALLHN